MGENRASLEILDAYNADESPASIAAAADLKLLLDDVEGRALVTCEGAVGEPLIERPPGLGIGVLALRQNEPYEAVRVLSVIGLLHGR